MKPLLGITPERSCRYLRYLCIGPYPKGLPQGMHHARPFALLSELPSGKVQPLFCLCKPPRGSDASSANPKGMHQRSSYYPLGGPRPFRKPIGLAELRKPSGVSKKQIAEPLPLRVAECRTHPLLVQKKGHARTIIFPWA